MNFKFQISDIDLILANSTRSFNYPNISKLPKALRKQTCIIADNTEAKFVRSSNQKNILITDIDNYTHILKTQTIDKILIVSINHSSEYQTIIGQYLADNNLDIPIYNWFTEVLINLSLKQDINYRIKETKQKPKLLAILCTPRSGSQMLCDLMSQTKAFGYPKEHLTMPIVLPAEYNILDLDDWFSKLIAANRTDNNVCSTKLIASRVARLLNSIQRDKTINNLKKFKFVVLKRKNLFAQAVSLYFAKKNDQWHVNKNNITSKKTSVEYNFQKIEIIYLDLKQQEKNIDEILEKVKETPSNILNLYYEELVNNKKQCFQKLADFIEIEFKDSWITLDSNLTRASSDAKRKIENRFKQDFFAKNQC